MEIRADNFQAMLAVFRKFYLAAGVSLEEATLLVWCDGEDLRFIAYHGRVWLVWRVSSPGEVFCGVVQFRNLALLELGGGTEVAGALTVEKKRLLLRLRDVRLEVSIHNGGRAPELDFGLELVWGSEREWYAPSAVPRLRHLRAAVGKDSTRPHLRAWALTWHVGVATDGHRLHLVDLGACLPDGRRNAALPPLLLDAIAVLPGLSFLVSVGEQYFRARSSSGVWTAYAELSSTPFPDWERVLPASDPPPTAFALDISAFEFLAAARYMLSFGLPCNFFFKDMLVMQPVAGSGVWGEARLPCARSFGEPPASMCFNPAYLIDGVENLPGDVISVQGTDPEGPLELRCEGFRAVVMPLKR